MTVVEQALASTPDRPTEPVIWAGAFLAATLCGLAAVAIAPLAAYVWLIALFGMPHVLAELRYCDARFSARTDARALALIGALLGGLALTRLLGTYGWISGFVSASVELGFGAALALAAAIFMRRHKIVGALVAAAVALGALYAPFMTFLVWAWLHNLTPLAFVAEALEGRARRRALLALCVPFFVVPGLVALGGLEWLTATLFAYDALGAPSAFDAGARPLHAFLPPRTRLDDAIPLFQAAVLAQVMHYVAVIALMPRLLARTGGGRELVPWPRWPVFYGLLALAGGLSLAIYAADFGEARAAYAVAATLHSWIELPIFLLALGGGFRSASAAGTRPGPTRR